jgi:hypothetical protein
LRLAARGLLPLFSLHRGSLNPKAVGQRVEKASALGWSATPIKPTGPHLHLAVHSSTGALVDPFAGSCNPTTPTSTVAVAVIGNDEVPTF